MKRKPPLKQIITSEIVGRLGPGHAQADTLVYRDGGGDMLRGFYFEAHRKPGMDGLVFVNRFVMPLVRPAEHLAFTFGARIKSPQGNHLWDLHEDRRATTLPLLIGALQSQSLLEEVVDATSFVRHFTLETPEAKDIRAMEALAYCATYAERGGHEEHFARLAAFVRQHGNLEWEWVAQLYDTAVSMQKLSAAEVLQQMDAAIEENWQRVRNSFRRV